MASFSIHGDIIWTESPDSFRYIEGGYLNIEDGLVESVSSESTSCDILETDGSLVIPGLSDLHLHAPQYPYAGLYMDEELLEWLEHHTFPEEAKYRSLEYAEKAYSILVDDLKHSATTRVSVFGTIFTDSTLLLMRKLSDSGLSGYVGKVNMDRNSPDYLSEETVASISETLRFLESAPECSIKPIITPRFVPSCSDELLRALGGIAEERGLPIQTHLDENPSEIEWVKELCPWAGSYADAYDQFGLLNSRSIMAHTVWPDDGEIELLRKRGAFVAHAPSSNTNLSSGIAPIRRFIDEGIHVGLATDVAGGSSLSLFRMMQDAIGASKLRWRYVDSALRPLRFPEAFYLASKGGGAFFGSVGSFEKGWDADAVVIDDSICRTALRDELSVPERLELYAYRHPDESVKAKFVQGRRVL